MGMASGDPPWKYKGPPPQGGFPPGRMYVREGGDLQIPRWKVYRGKVKEIVGKPYILKLFWQQNNATLLLWKI